MTAYRTTVLAAAALLVAVLIGLHAPGQMSVDSGIALYEGAVGRAEGWGPTFFAAVLAWLGGGALGAALFVGLNSLATYGCFAALLIDRAETVKSAWPRLVGVLLALNPVFMFYVGIVWKDVMLATVVLLATTALFLASGRGGRRRQVLLGIALLAIAAAPLLRQQGFLLAVPLGTAAAWLVAVSVQASPVRRIVVAMVTLAMLAGTSFTLDRIAKRTIEPLPSSPVSVGMLTIRAYDIVGMVAYARPGDESNWSGADEATKEQIRRLYSPERIDTLWHDPAIRNYINGLAEVESKSVWQAGIRHDPVAYLSHRVQAFAYLLGFKSMKGCVPAYWGVAAPRQYLERVGLVEEMDPRDRVIGHWSEVLQPTIVFRHWFYAALLLAAVTVLSVRVRGEGRIVGWAGAVGAGLYLASFAPTTIACDFRYLYPVTCLSTALLIASLNRARGGARMADV